MALKRCSQCSKDVSADSNFCPHCGANIRSASSSSDPWLIGILILLVVVVWFFIENSPLMSSSLSQNQDVTHSEASLYVPSDSSARYTVIEHGSLMGNPTLTVRREGKSGVSFSKRLFDCNNNSAKYLGTGDSLQEMNSAVPDSTMTTNVEGSIQYWQWAYVCNK